MNPTTQQPNPPPQQQQPPILFPPPLPPPPLHQQQPPQLLQPHRPSTSCDRHPQEQFTGFCPSCLCERLAVLDPNGASSSSSGPRKSTSSSTAAALRAIFRPSTGRGNRPPLTSSSFFPELRRTKSFSASKNYEGFSGAFEPQRKSCDVRVRSTLFSLFNQDDELKIPKKEVPQNLASSSVVQGPVTEEEEPDSASLPEEEEEIVEEEGEEYEENDDEIRVLEEHPNVALPNNVIEERVTEIVEEEPEPEPEHEPEPEIVVVDEEEFLKPMKEHIDLDSQVKKSSGRDFKEIAGSFWSAASVFSKKLQKWRQKQKLKRQRCRNGAVSVGSANTLLPVEKPIGRQFRETQSEIADYGFGRRSCDTDPRFSLDIGRMSFEAGRVSLDDPRYSFDEPRASWDGYLIGRTFTRMPTMLSVVEDAPVRVMRADTQIPVEEPVLMNAITENDDEAKVPGGSLQTKEYYSDSSSRRKSLDRSSSIRKTAAAVVAEMDELKPVSGAIPVANAKVTPAVGVCGGGGGVDYLHHGQKAVFPDKDLRDRDLNSNSLRDDCSDTFELGSGAGINSERKGSKKSFRWSKAWNIWGLINRRGGGGNKDDDEENRYSRGNGSNGVERSLSESWQDFRGERIMDARGGFNRNALRSNSSVSWRNAQGIGSIEGAPFGTMRKSDVQANGYGKKARDEVVLERNRSARYSPNNNNNNNNMDNGLLRLYVTPMRGSRRNWPGKGRSNQAHSIARSVLRLH